MTKSNRRTGITFPSKRSSNNNNNNNNRMPSFTASLLLVCALACALHASVASADGCHSDEQCYTQPTDWRCSGMKTKEKRERRKKAPSFLPLFFSSPFPSLDAVPCKEVVV